MNKSLIFISFIWDDLVRHWISPAILRNSEDVDQNWLLFFVFPPPPLQKKRNEPFDKRHCTAYKLQKSFSFSARIPSSSDRLPRVRIKLDSGWCSFSTRLLSFARALASSSTVLLSKFRCWSFFSFWSANPHHLPFRVRLKQNFSLETLLWSCVNFRSPVFKSSTPTPLTTPTLKTFWSVQPKRVPLRRVFETSGNPAV